MHKAMDTVLIGVGVLFTAFVISLVVFVANKGTLLFEASTKPLEESVDNDADIKRVFDNKVLKGSEIKMFCQQFGDDYNFMVQTCWMRNSGAEPYRYGGKDPLIGPDKYRNKSSMYYFNEEAEYSSTLIIDDGVCVGFLLVQMSV